MLDAVDPIVMPLSDTSVCPACGTSFMRKRSNQKYCSRPCQRKTSRNTARGDRKVENKQRSRTHYERAAELKEMIYSTPPLKRLGMMRHILSFVPNDAGLRNILTDPELHMEPPQADNRKNIAKAANAYTRKFFGLSIKPYIKKVCSGEELESVKIQASMRLLKRINHTRKSEQDRY